MYIQESTHSPSSPLQQKRYDHSTSPKGKKCGVKVGMGGGIRLRMQAAISVCTKGAELTAAFHYEGDVVICQTSWPARPRCFDLFLVSLVLFLHIF